MAAYPLTWGLAIGGAHWQQLSNHLFPGDHDEHGAVLRCGIARTESTARLLVREVIPAKDGVDYVPGTHGYRKLTAAFVLEQALRFADDNSVYLAVHCHGGRDRVAFSGTDLDSHERGYPGLLELIGAPVVGALVFAEGAVAGDFWLKDGTRAPLAQLTVAGMRMRTLRPEPLQVRPVEEAYNRQARLLGDRGQEILRRQKVAIIGLGGAGSLINELVARLGVAEILLIDNDIIEPSNLSRVVGATSRDAMTVFVDPARPRWLRRLGTRLATKKVDVAARVARAAAPRTTVTPIASPVERRDVAHQLLDCDHIFLAADTHTARLLVNTIAQQYLIPVTQIGAKATVDKPTGDLAQVFAVSRLVLPGQGCLWCNGLISPRRLTEEATAADQLDRQRYVDDETVHQPSVISLNSVAASRAVNDWMFRTTGLLNPEREHLWFFADALTGDDIADLPRQDRDCPYCGPRRYGLGDARSLPTSAQPARTRPSTRSPSLSSKRSSG